MQFGMLMALDGTQVKWCTGQYISGGLNWCYKTTSMYIYIYTSYFENILVIISSTGSNYDDDN